MFFFVLCSCCFWPSVPAQSIAWKNWTFYESSVTFNSVHSLAQRISSKFFTSKITLYCFIYSGLTEHAKHLFNILWWTVFKMMILSVQSFMNSDNLQTKMKSPHLTVLYKSFLQSTSHRIRDSLRYSTYLQPATATLLYQESEDHWQERSLLLHPVLGISCWLTWNWTIHLPHPLPSNGIRGVFSSEQHIINIITNLITAECAHSLIVVVHYKCIRLLYRVRHKKIIP